MVAVKPFFPFLSLQPRGSPPPVEDGVKDVGGGNTRTIDLPARSTDGRNGYVWHPPDERTLSHSSVGY